MMNGVSSEKEGAGGRELSPEVRRLAEEWLSLDRVSRQRSRTILRP